MNLCTGFVFLSLLEFGVVNKVLSRGEGQGEAGTKEEEEKEDESSPGPGKTESNNREDWQEVRSILRPSKGSSRRDYHRVARWIDRVSGVVFPASFVALNAFYWIVFGSNSKVSC